MLEDINSYMIFVSISTIKIAVIDTVMGFSFRQKPATEMENFEREFNKTRSSKPGSTASRTRTVHSFQLA
jgi:hypothetical protein